MRDTKLENMMKIYLHWILYHTLCRHVWYPKIKMSSECLKDTPNKLVFCRWVVITIGKVCVMLRTYLSPWEPSKAWYNAQCTFCYHNVSFKPVLPCRNKVTRTPKHAFYFCILFQERWPWETLYKIMIFKHEQLCHFSHPVGYLMSGDWYLT